MKKISAQFRMLLLWAYALHLGILGVCIAQNEQTLQNALAKANEDTNKVGIFHELAYLAYQNSTFDKAQNYAQEALNLSEKLDYKEGNAKSHILLGDIFRQKRDFNLALKSYFQTERLYDFLNNKQQLYEVYQKIASLYQEQQEYAQALKFYNKIPTLSQANKANLPLLEKRAYCYKMLADWANAYQDYQKILYLYQAENKPAQTIATLQELALIAQTIGKYDLAEQHTEALLPLYKREKNWVEVSNTYNNLGFLAKRKGNVEEAHSYFKQALELYEKQISNIEGEKKAILLINTGVAYTNLQQYAKAKRCYQDALKIRTNLQNPTSIADAYNYLAANYLVANNLNQALKSVNTAIEIGEKQKAYHVLATSYQILVLIAQQNNDNQLFQSTLQKLQETENKLKETENQKRTELQQRQKMIEKEENDLKNLLLLEEKTATENRRLLREKEKQEKEIQLLKQEKELREAKFRNEQLEKERISQLLALAQQKAETEKQKAEAEKQRIETERQKAIALQKEQANELLKKENALKQAQAEAKQREQEQKLKMQEMKTQDEKTIRFYTTLALILTAMLLVFAVFAYWQNQKKNKKLAEQNAIINEQNEELQVQNEELHQQQQEIMAQRDFIEEQKKVLEKQYEQITQSIHVAETIQRAVLPSSKYIERYVNDYFIIYRPKDVVSGDFYWANHTDNIFFAIAIDCTGHGVPGAFMSMIANTLLDNTIKVKRLTNPTDILNEMDARIKASVKNDENLEELSAGGMDMCIAAIHLEPKNGNYLIHYGGAKRPLYYLTPNEEEVNTLKPTRRSIGWIPSNEFTTQEVLLPKGSRLYLSSDGLTDQNNAKRQKFGEKYLFTLIKETRLVNMKQQAQHIEQALDNFQKDTVQRDDILLWGIEL
ncbi:MAG: tetratricopeptide repeat protein [Microscillaceae bacterium]|nr:tetratricopeptide repeat protein [Microscillaceae bacterium]MDW8460339.1 tetratricopeptide repeat protein [Cytophagales bacterium]